MEERPLAEKTVQRPRGERVPDTPAVQRRSAWLEQRARGKEWQEIRSKREGEVSLHRTSEATEMLWFFFFFFCSEVGIPLEQQRDMV